MLAQQFIDDAPSISRHYLLLASGNRFTFDGPIQPIAIEDIASALSKLCRWGGATREFYSVAQHSVHVSRLAAKIAEDVGGSAELQQIAAFAGLMHDAHEMVLADICRPTKGWMDETHYRGFGSGLSSAEQIIDMRLGEALGSWAGSLHRRRWKVANYVRTADNLALAIERRDLMPPVDEVWPGIPTDTEIVDHPPITPLEWRHARDLFVARWHALIAGTAP